MSELDILSKAPGVRMDIPEDWDYERIVGLCQKVEGIRWQIIGASADRVEVIRGEGTLRKFADDIGVPFVTVEHYRRVWRAWKDEPAIPGTYGVASALATAANRAEVFAGNPDMTKKDAEKAAASSDRVDRRASTSARCGTPTKKGVCNGPEGHPGKCSSTYIKAGRKTPEPLDPSAIIPPEEKRPPRKPDGTEWPSRREYDAQCWLETVTLANAYAREKKSTDGLTELQKTQLVQALENTIAYLKGTE